MKCVIPGSGIKAFGKAIFCLSKIGEELYIEALDDGVALKTVNTARSAFASFLFERKFFHLYQDSGGGCDSEEDNGFKCKISTRSVLSVFKALHTLERTVDHCTLNLDPRGNNLVFVFHCKHGIVRTHSLGYQECEALQAVFTKELCPNHISTPAKVLSDVVTHFPTSLDEVTLTAHPTVVTLRNYVEDTGDGGGRPSQTEISLVPEEFDHYQVGVDSSITFCLKELRAILTFTDSINHSLSMRFEESGRPVVLSIEDGKNYKADFVLATLLDDSSTQSSQSAATVTLSQTHRSNGFDTHHTTISHDSTTLDNTLADTRQPSTSRTAPKARASVRPLHSVTADMEFPFGSQFRPPSQPHSTSTTGGARVPSPPNDLDFLDMEVEYAENRDTPTSRRATKGKSPQRKASQREEHSLHRASSSQLRVGEGGHQTKASGSGIGSTDDYDVMDAIFGVENLNDVADEGNEFGFGVERQSTVSQSIHRERDSSPGEPVSQARGQSWPADEARDVCTQDSIINDSGFLPRSPPTKKHKPNSALFGVTLFSGDQSQSEVLAPDSDEDEL